MSKIFRVLAFASLTFFCVFGLECFDNMDCRCDKITQKCLTACSEVKNTSQCEDDQVCSSVKLTYLHRPLSVIRRGCAEPDNCEELNGTIPAFNVTASECLTCTSDKCNDAVLELPTPVPTTPRTTTPASTSSTSTISSSPGPGSSTSAPGTSTSSPPSPPGNSGLACPVTSLGLLIAISVVI